VLAASRRCQHEVRQSSTRTSSEPRPQDSKLISDLVAAVVQEVEAFDFGKVLPQR
jgi:hypothetical protein